MPDDSNGTVSYSVKELIARLDGKLDGIFLSLSAKADKQDVDSIRDRVIALENSVEKQSVVGADRRWIFTQVLAVFSILVAVLVAYNTITHFH